MGVVLGRQARLSQSLSNRRGDGGRTLTEEKDNDRFKSRWQKAMGKRGSKIEGRMFEDAATI